LADAKRNLSAATDFKASMGMDDLVLSHLWPFIFFVAFNMCSMTITFAVVMRPMIKQLKQLDKWHRSGINEAAFIPRRS
jgi:hypothetical protein